MKVFSDAVDGFRADLVEGGRSGFSSVPYPAVVSRMTPRRAIATSEARFLRDHTEGKTLVAVPSPYTIGRRMWVEEHSRSAYATREEFMEACIPIVRREIEALASLGVDAIQLDDPWLALLVDPEYREREGVTDIEHEIEMCVRCVNGATEGIKDVFVSVHLCHAHFNRRHSTRGPYNLIIGALGRMNVQRFAMEFATPDAGGLGVLRDFPDDKLLGLGVIDHTDRHVETPEEVAARAERALGVRAEGAPHSEPGLRVLALEHEPDGPGRGPTSSCGRCARGRGCCGSAMDDFGRAWKPEDRPLVSRQSRR